MKHVSNTASLPPKPEAGGVVSDRLCSFIAHDWCGWNEQYGRFTALPNGETLVCQAWMRQRDWDKAQLEWLERFDGDVFVHRCNTGPYRETGDTMGTVAEIIRRLRARLA